MSKFSPAKRPMETVHVFNMETLESRQLLSAWHGHRGGALSSIEFNQTPAVVQAGLNALASQDSLTAPIDTTKVQLGNANGVETYTVKLTGTGTSSRLTVDQNGNAITAPTRTTTTFGALDPGPAGEISAIATALSLTAPISTTTVHVLTTSAGAATYSISLAPSDTTRHHRSTITVDAAGNPVGNERLPFSVLPDAVKTALTSNTPAGATALTDTSNVSVRTVDGVTLYSATFTSTGTRTTISVNSGGVLTSARTVTSTTFGALDTTLQSALQTLATDGGSTATIAADASVRVTTEANGVVLYSVAVTVTSTDSDGDTHTRNLTVTIDASGNPTVLSGESGGGRLFGDDRFDRGGDRGRGDSSTASASGTNSSGSSTESVSSRRSSTRRR